VWALENPRTTGLRSVHRWHRLGPVLKIIKANLGDILIGLLLVVMVALLIWFMAIHGRLVDDPTQ
jgi:hypothetical protein